MKLLVEPDKKDISYLDSVDGIILPLEKYAVESVCFFSIDEIIDIKSKSSCEVFVKINKNLFNNDIDDVGVILTKLSEVGVDGVFFYDLALLQLKNELGLDIALIWSQTHMVNNYKTCDYYYNRGVSYALLSKEITIDEIIDIINKSEIMCMVEVVSKPCVAFSYRKLISNYYDNYSMDGPLDINIKEKITGDHYNVIEDENGACFYLDKITNGTEIIDDLYRGGCPYIIFREYGIDNMRELVIDTKRYIDQGCIDNSYISKYKKLGDSTNFFFKKTIYKVK